LNLNGYDIYWLAKKSNLGAKVGELVDENLNEYKKVGGRTGALYSTDFTINAGTKYFIDRSIKNINNKNL
jgi:hypothetical protein